MEATRLRIGNAIHRTNKLTKKRELIYVTASDILDISGNGSESSFIYSGIILTECDLIKLGFEEIKPLENDVHKWSTYSKNGVHIDLPYFEFNIEEISKEIKYVHQLQNLYFALTGSELQYVA